jgi:uncharacterized protein
MGPLIPLGYIDPQWNNVIALLIGMAFGFILEGAGFSSSRRLVGVFYGYDFVVLRVFFTAAITGMIGMLYFHYMGWMDMTMLYINPTYLAATAIGGVIMGLGFITGGYCPGTSIAGIGIGKIDALVFTGGMFLGIFIFSEMFPILENLYNSTFYGDLRIYDTLGVDPAGFVFFTTLAAVIIFFVIGLIEDRVKKVEY